jgi:hypothetical protein
MVRLVDKEEIRFRLSEAGVRGGVVTRGAWDAARKAKLDHRMVDVGNQAYFRPVCSLDSQQFSAWAFRGQPYSAQHANRGHVI